jgi:hypothetical protein
MAKEPKLKKLNKLNQKTNDLFDSDKTIFFTSHDFYSDLRKHKIISKYLYIKETWEYFTDFLIDFFENNKDYSIEINNEIYFKKLFNDDEKIIDLINEKMKGKLKEIEGAA